MTNEITTESHIFLTKSQGCQTDAPVEKLDPNALVTIPYGLFERLMDESTKYKILMHQALMLQNSTSNTLTQEVLNSKPVEIFLFQII